MYLHVRNSPLHIHTVSLLISLYVLLFFLLFIIKLVINLPPVSGSLPRTRCPLTLMSAGLFSVSLSTKLAIGRRLDSLFFSRTRLIIIYIINDSVIRPAVLVSCLNSPNRVLQEATLCSCSYVSLFLVVLLPTEEPPISSPHHHASSYTHQTNLNYLPQIPHWPAHPPVVTFTWISNSILFLWKTPKILGCFVKCK